MPISDPHRNQPATSSMALDSLTDLDRPEHEPARQNQRCCESESCPQAVLTSLKNAVLMMDSNGLVIYANPATFDVLGYRPEELLQRNLHEILADEQHPEEFHQTIAATRENTVGEKISSTVERKARHKDGRELSVEISLSSTKINGKWHAVGSIRDITKSVSAGQELVAARIEAERANRAKSQFLSRMSHELRTPMNAILGFGQLLQYDDNLSDEQQSNLGEIMKAGYHLLDLINEILDLSKVEMGHIDLVIEPVVLPPLIDECLQLIRGQCEKRRLNASFQCPQQVTVRADRTRLKQVLLNLLSNAVKYNKDCGSIQIDTQPGSAGHLCIRITDSGIGIPAERLADLFQPFNRLEQSKHIEGTGIGLNISQQLVSMMGGTLLVTSEIDSGSCFEFELPLALPETTATLP